MTDLKATPPYGHEMVHVAVQPVPCNFSRAELNALLKDSNYGENQRAFEAYFRAAPGGHGAPLCQSCGLTIADHSNGALPAAGGAAEGTVVASGPMIMLQHVNVTLAETLRRSNANRENTLAEHRLLQEYPEHWMDYAWYHRLLVFDSWNGVAMHRNGCKMRCVHTGSDGHECGATFDVVGVLTDAGGLIDFSPHADIKEHMRAAHGIVDPVDERSAARRSWSSGLLACGSHPRSCCDCIFCYPCVNLIAPTNHAGFCCRLESFPSVDAKTTGQLAIHGYDPAAINCSGWDLCNVLMLPGSLHATAFGLLVTAVSLVASIVTICGLPCEGVPIFMCYPCYSHRRDLVLKRGIDEHHAVSKLTVLFCFPCSECQVWRELYDSGVWPGLCCSTANAEEVAWMEPEAVRRRYGMTYSGSGSGDCPTWKRRVVELDLVPPCVAVS